MKILSITEDDLDGYWDWLLPDKAIEFANGNYTHVEWDGSVTKAEIVAFDHNGDPMVSIGEMVSQ